MDIQWSPDLLLTLLLTVGFFKGVEPLQQHYINITAVNIPKVIRAGTDEPIILDCKYEMGSSSTRGLVIKWYVNQELLYQWIHGKPPKGSDEFSKYVDESFKASSNPDTMYRAVKLVRPGHDLSGNVRCVISTQYDEVEATEKMLVYSPETVFQLSHRSLNADSNRLAVVCLAENLYPWPTISIRRDSEPMEGLKRFYKNKTDGRFSVEAIAVLNADKLLLPTIFRCEITIAEANYTSVREYVFNGGELPRLSFIVIIVACVIRRKH